MNRLWNKAAPTLCICLAYFSPLDALGQAPSVPTNLRIVGETGSCGSLVSRLSTKTVSVLPVQGQRYTAVYTSTTWQQAPIRAAATAGNGTIIAWNPNDMTGLPDSQEGNRVAEVHITRVDENGVRLGPDWLIPGLSVNGLVVLPDGYALTIRRRPPGGSTDGIDDRLLFVKYRLDGTIAIPPVELVNGDGTSSKPTVIQNHIGDLVWSGTNFIAYFATNAGHWKNTSRTISPTGVVTSGGTGGYCSHSLDERLAWNSSTSVLAAVCMGDAYPSVSYCVNLPPDETTLGGWGGIGGNNTWLSTGGTRNFQERVGCGGWSASRGPWTSGGIGGLVPARNGFYFLYASMERPGNPTLNTCRTSSDDNVVPSRCQRDINLIFLSSAAPVRTWVSPLDGIDKQAPHLTLFGDGMLAGWRTEPFSDARFYIQQVDINGNMLGSPEDVGGAWFSDRDKFFKYENGDAGWVWVKERVIPGQLPNAHSTELQLVRVRRCP